MNSTIIRLFFASLLATFPCTVPLFGQTALPPSTPNSGENEVVKLPQFSVSAEKGDPYRAADITSVNRISGSLMETGLSVAVVTKEMMTDLGANSAYDVTRYFAGISNGRGAGIGGIMDRQDFRGYENFTRTVDNFSTLLIPTAFGFQATFEPEFVERMEVVMGPDSILSPTGAAGGAVNMITKSPQFTAANELMLAVGNYNAGKVAVDSTGPINKHLAYRVIAVYQDAQTYVPGQVIQENLGLELTYKFTEQTQLTFKYFGIDWEQRGAVSGANDNGWLIATPDTVGGVTISKNPPLGLPYNGWNGNALWSHRYDRVNMFNLEFITPLFNRVEMRFGASFLNDNFLQDQGYPSANPAETFDPNTGQVIGVTPGFTPTSVPIVGNYAHDLQYDYQLQNDFAANFHPGPVSLKPVVGWAYQQGSDPTNLNYQNKTGYPNADITVNDPYLAPHLPMQTYTLSGDQPAHGRQDQIYGVIKVGVLEDRLLTTLGASRIWIDSNNYTFATPDPTAKPVTQLTLISRKDTYLAGILGKPLKNVSTYYTFSTNAALTSNSGQPLWQSGRQHEFGLKAEFLNQRLAFTTDHFQIAQTNLVTPNPAHNTDATQPANVLGAATNHGEEAMLVGGITDNLSVVASMTWMKYRDQFFRRVRNVPDVLDNLLLNYRFASGTLKRLSVYVGIEHFGQVAGETASTTPLSNGTIKQVGFYVPSWTVANAGLGYVRGRYRFNLDIDNVLDTKAVWEPASRQSVSPYPGITVRLTTRLAF